MTRGVRPLTIKQTLLAAIVALGITQPLHAASYLIDTAGAHAAIQFRIQHLGYSWLHGRFNHFSGSFEYDESSPESAAVKVEIDVASIDSNHAERDNHLRGEDFLAVDQFPKASFVSQSFTPLGDGKGRLKGEFTLHGVTRPLTIEVEKIGAGPDPWGGERIGFEGKTRFALKAFGIDYDLGPASQEVEINLSIEGIRQ
jgi:polyisoprenoid-binding protein YceI